MLHFKCIWTDLYLETWCFIKYSHYHYTLGWWPVDTNNLHHRWVMSQLRTDQSSLRCAQGMLSKPMKFNTKRNPTWNFQCCVSTYSPDGTSTITKNVLSLHVLEINAIMNDHKITTRLSIWGKSSFYHHCCRTVWYNIVLKPSNDIALFWNYPCVITVFWPSLCNFWPVLR